MFGSAIIDVAIGLVFVFFLLSSIAFHVNEFVARMFHWRQKDLEGFLHELLGTEDFAHEFLQHPLIGVRPHENETVEGHLHAGHGPSYIDPKVFAAVLFDFVFPSDGRPTRFERLRQLAQDLGRPGTDEPGGDAAPMIPPEVGEAVLGIVNSAEQTVTGIRSGFEGWFNAAMDRLAGVYRRRLMLVNLVTAICLTVAIGVDAIALAVALWQEQGVRSAVAGAAQHADGGGLGDALGALTQLNLPLGWTTHPATWTEWSLKVAGLAISTLAVSLGAPFWFDLLKNLSNLRASGPKPADGGKK